MVCLPLNIMWYFLSNTSFGWEIAPKRENKGRSVTQRKGHLLPPPGKELVLQSKGFRMGVPPPRFWISLKLCVHMSGESPTHSRVSSHSLLKISSRVHDHKTGSKMHLSNTVFWCPVTQRHWEPWKFLKKGVLIKTFHCLYLSLRS